MALRVVRKQGCRAADVVGGETATIVVHPPRISAPNESSGDEGCSQVDVGGTRAVTLQTCKPDVGRDGAPPTRCSLHNKTPRGESESGEGKQVQAMQRRALVPKRPTTHSSRWQPTRLFADLPRRIATGSPRRRVSVSEAGYRCSCSTGAGRIQYLMGRQIPCRGVP